MSAADDMGGEAQLGSGVFGRWPNREDEYQEVVVNGQAIPSALPARHLAGYP